MLKFKKIEKISFDFTIATLICLVISTVFCVWYAFTKNWIANNILGTAFSVQAVALISPGTYQTGCILLVLIYLFIFWYFLFIVSFYGKKGIIIFL